MNPTYSVHHGHPVPPTVSYYYQPSWGWDGQQGQYGYIRNNGPDAHLRPLTPTIIYPNPLLGGVSPPMLMGPYIPIHHTTRPWVSTGPMDHVDPPPPYVPIIATSGRSHPPPLQNYQLIDREGGSPHLVTSGSNLRLMPATSITSAVTVGATQQPARGAIPSPVPAEATLPPTRPTRRPRQRQPATTVVASPPTTPAGEATHPTTPTTAVTSPTRSAASTRHTHDPLMVGYPKPEGEVDIDQALLQKPGRWSLSGQREANKKQKKKQKKVKELARSVETAVASNNAFEATKKELRESFKTLKITHHR